MRNFVPTQLVQLYGLVGYLLVKDVYGRYLLVFKFSQSLNIYKEIRQRKRPRWVYYIRMGKIYPYLL